MNSNDEPVEPVTAENPVYGVGYPEAFAEFAISLCASALRHIRILSPHLDHIVFDNAELANIISALARRDSHSRVQILISDSRPLVNRGHRLLNLARRLPSSIFLLKLERHPEMTGDTVITRDLDGVLFMPADEGPGFYEPNSRASAQQFIDKFDLLWQRATPDPNFRRLGL